MIMGAAGSKLRKALYLCVPFREQLLEYYATNKSTGDVEENLLTFLADLFSHISSQKKKTVLLLPRGLSKPSLKK